MSCLLVLQIASGLNFGLGSTVGFVLLDNEVVLGIAAISLYSYERSKSDPFCVSSHASSSQISDPLYVSSI